MNNEILKKIDDLLVAAQKHLDQAEQANKKAAEDIAILSGKEKAVTEKEACLVIREAEVKKVEDVVALKNEIASREADLGRERQAFRDECATFNKWHSAELARIQGEARDLEGAKTRLAQKTAEVDAAIEDLKVRKENYKKEALAELAGKA